MVKGNTNIKRYTLGEEIFNSVSHGVGTFFAIAGCAVMIVVSVIYGDVFAVVSSAIYGSTMFILYLSSTLYHSFTNNKVKEVFRVFDHCTIFLLIAGTYTPYTLISLRGTIDIQLCIFIWAAAIIGIILNSIDLKKYEKISVALYLLMGWAIVFTIKPLIASLSFGGLLLLVLGGIMYSLGVIFYLLTKYRYMHSIWHLFVLAGTILHYFSILFFVIPTTF